MSDGGHWQPPEPGTVAPDPSPTVELGEASPPPTKPRGMAIAAVVGGAAVIAAAVFGITRVTGGDDDGGASTPEEAGLALLDALENEDALGAIDVLLPGERESLREPLTALNDELTRVEVLSEDVLTGVSGVDFVVEDESVSATETNVPDIVNLEITATVTGSVDGEQLPIGDLLLDNIDVDRSELDEEPSEPTEDTFPVTAVEQDGRWYLSVFHTLAEQVRTSSDESNDIPAKGVVATGGDSPEDAVDRFLAAVENLDLEAMIAALNPEEFQALQRYAPIFLEEAQADLDEAVAENGTAVSIEDADYTVSGSGDTRSLSIDHLSADFTEQGETGSFEFEDGCFKITPPDPGQSINSCELTEDTATLVEVFGSDVEPVQDVLATLEGALADYENPGFIVKQVDGQWYLSPLATVSEQLLAVAGAFDREEIEQLTDDVSAAVDAVEGSDIDIGSVFGPDDGDFQSDAETFIEEDDGDVEAQLGVALDEATCEDPGSSDVGTVFSCTAVGDDGQTYEFTVEITGENRYEVGGGTVSD